MVVPLEGAVVRRVLIDFGLTFYRIRTVEVGNKLRPTESCNCLCNDDNKISAV